MDVVRYLSDEGTPLQALPFSHDELLRGYCALRRARFWDERAEVLQRQGKLSVYPPYRGQEAAQVGMMLAFGKDDWLVPSYRESAAALAYGLPLETLILYWRAHPAGWRFPEELNILPFYIPIATQLPQAVGLAHGLKLQGRSQAVATFIGDGGTSEGDFHEALNFASVFDAPVVFMVQNNGWAISVPTSKQMKTKSIASRAAGYEMPGVCVDGNDLVAVWGVAKEAVGRAQRPDEHLGEGQQHQHRADNEQQIFEDAQERAKPARATRRGGRLGLLAHHRNRTPGHQYASTPPRRKKRSCTSVMTKMMTNSTKAAAAAHPIRRSSKAVWHMKSAVTLVLSPGPPLVRAKIRSNEPMPVIKLVTVTNSSVGRSSGRVLCQKLAQIPAPSTCAASVYEVSRPSSPTEKISIFAPSAVQMATMITAHMV